MKPRNSLADAEGSWSLALCGCAFTLLSLLGCGPDAKVGTLESAEGLDRVKLMLNWYPEAEHGGFYAAKVHGIFEKHGLDVEIVPGGPNSPVAQQLATGRTEFAVGNADDVLLFRQQEAKILALLAPIQDTPRCILVRESSPVKSLRQLTGMRLQANAGRPFLDFMKSEGLLDGVQVVPYPGTVANFIADENTAIQAYSFSEPLLAQQSGVPARKLMLSEIGFNPYASCLIATEDYVKNHSEIADRMTAACREGWQQYLQDAEQTNATILEQNQHGMTMEALAFGIKELRPLCVVRDDGPPGSMTSQRWSELIDQFEQLGLLTPGTVTAADVYRSQHAASDALP